MKSLGYIVLACSLSLTTTVVAQQNGGTTNGDTDSTQVAQHAAAMQLVAALGTRETLLNNKEKGVEQGKQAMRLNYPTYDPQFVDEWGKRFLARYNVEDYLTVIANVYAKHLTLADLNELNAAAKKPGSIASSALSPALKEKLATSMVSLQSEIIGAAAQVGSKLGGTIGMEIAKEHPDWVKPN